MAFALNSYPVAYRAKFSNSTWTEEYIEKPHKKAEEEAAMESGERAKIEASRKEKHQQNPTATLPKCMSFQQLIISINH